MNKKSVLNVRGLLSAAVVACASFVSFAADTPTAGVELVDLTGSGKGTASSMYTSGWTDGSAATAFDNNFDNRSIYNSQTCDWRWTFNEPTVVNAYKIYAPKSDYWYYSQRMPKDFRLEAKNTADADWTTLDTRSNETAAWTAKEGRYYECNNGTAYDTYRIVSTATIEGGSGYSQLAEIEFFNVPKFTVSNAAMTAPANGSSTITGTVVGGSGSIKAVFTPTTAASNVEVALGSFSGDDTLNITIDAATAGLSLRKIYSAKLVCTADGISLDLPIAGTFYFGEPATPGDMAKKIEISVGSDLADILGSEILTDIPVPVRLSTAIEGFDYSDFQMADVSDVVFTDANGNELAYEVDTWDTAGTSVVWVKIPELSASTVITCWYGGGHYAHTSEAVWSDFIGVWHMNGGSGVETDVTGHGYNATPKQGGSGNLSQMAATEGVIGSARINATANVSKGNYLSIPSYNAENCNGVFTFSGWFRLSAVSSYPRLVSRKNSYTDDKGWEVEMNNGSQTKADIRGSRNDKHLQVDFANFVNDWVYMSLVFNGTSLSVYGNGSLLKSGTIDTATDNGLPLSIGNNSNGSEAAINGKYDEVRLSKGTMDATRIAVDHYAGRNADALSYSAVQPVDDTAPSLAPPTVVRNNDGSFTISAEISKNAPAAGTVKCVIGANEYAMSGSGIGTYATTVSGLATGTYICQVKAESTGGTEVSKACPNAFYAGDLAIAKIADANEFGLVSGSFRISRADTAGDLTVNFEIDDVTSTAIAGQTYTAPVSPVTIPDGADHVDVAVAPLIDAAIVVDTVVKVDLASGLYGIDANNASMTMTIQNLVAPAGWNTWVATSAGLASVGSNWSAGHSPTSSEKVLFDGRFSNANCEWDVDSSHTVAAWKHESGDGVYTGTVTIDATYDDTFPVLTVAGDMSVGSGKISHPANSTAETYRLNVSVGGDFTLGADAKIDALGKGFSVGKARPGSAIACHASSPQGNYSYVYGNVREPEALGSGGHNNNNSNSSGGGAVKLAVTGAAVIDGTIDVRSSSQKKNGNNPEKGVGAGGSIWIAAASVSGAGVLNASAYTADIGETSYQEAGSGGRIAVVATTGSVSIPLANLKANCGYGKPGAGGGTIYVKSSSEVNGTLLVGSTKGHEWNFQVRYPAKKAVTIVPPGESWTFDRVYIRGYGIIGVPEGATLVLPNGFASVSNTETADPANGGILYLGGTINATKVDGRHTISGSWFFQADTPFTFDGDLYCDDKAGIGNFFLLQPQATNIVHNIVTVNGDMTVTSSGRIYAAQRGHRNTTSVGLRGAHGGIALNSITLGDVPYDSIFHPMYSGSCGQQTGTGAGDSGNTNDGSGAIKLTVAGTLQLDSTANFNTVNRTGDFHRGGAGSFDLTCGFLTGSGAISANGTTGAGERYAGGGGRIAVKLTGTGATVSSAWRANINAKGNNGGNGAYCYSSAGTVYLQNAGEADGAGTIIVRNLGNTSITAPTILPGAKWGAETAAGLRKAKLVIEGASIVRPAEALKFASADIAENSKIDLFGNNVTVAVATLAGSKLEPGAYQVAADGALDGHPEIVNTGDSAATFTVTGLGTTIIVR